MQRAYLAYKEQGVVFLGVFVISKEKDIRKFAEKYQLTFPVGRDNGIAEVLGTKAIPTTFFINREGSIVKRYIGPIDFDTLKDGIMKIIKE